MEAVAWDLCKEFSRTNGVRVSVLTTACKALPPLSVQDGVEIRTVASPPGRYSMLWWLRARQAYRRYYEGQTDIILSVSAAAFSLPLAGKNRPLTVAQVHGTAWGEFKSKWRQLKFWPALKSLRNAAWMIRDLRYRQFDRIIAIGPAVLRELQLAPTRWIMGQQQFDVISNGINLAEFCFDPQKRRLIRGQLGLNETDRTVISVSRLHAQKGVLEALEGFATAARLDEDLRYIIVGSGPQHSLIRKRIAELNLEDRVRLMGEIPREKVPDLFSAADIFLFTSKRVEGLPTNVLEALGNGLPIIASAHIADDRIGVTPVDPDDANEVSSALLRVKPHLNRSPRLVTELTLEFAASQYIKTFDPTGRHVGRENWKA
ncbi:glycosyltransferase family 4 protein [Bradyrhizobium ottawaense]|uniref:glycosyltransferase family 4 protein n=1 Tax=Bradyrhizobium ottawaense TaxID=931866 RepID=UPI002714EC77|nr:glycosyltransferase family 4 protein [Bradyrhizobium ottawaense]WLB47936.1 glycosyltransferase family 4 protein [Bradyrhizobium ottawaense]